MDLGWQPTLDDIHADHPNRQNQAHWREIWAQDEPAKKTLILRHIIYVQRYIEHQFDLSLSTIELVRLRHATVRSLDAFLKIDLSQPLMPIHPQEETLRQWILECLDIEPDYWDQNNLTPEAAAHYVHQRYAAYQDEAALP